MSPIPDRVAYAAGRRQLALPLLLFLAGQRPLAFFAGQLLYAAQPLCALLGLPSCTEWAAVLSDPDHTDRLISMLDRHAATSTNLIPSAPHPEHVLE